MGGGKEKWRWPRAAASRGVAILRVSASEKKSQALITMLVERDYRGIG
jgi:hypothetical protein